MTPTVYVPLSSGVKLNDALVPVANGDPFFFTAHMYVKLSSSGSVTFTVAVICAPSGDVDTTTIEAAGGSFTGVTEIKTVPVFDVLDPSLTVKVKLSGP